MKKMHKQNLEVCKHCVFAKSNVRVHRFHDQNRLRPNLSVKILQPRRYVCIRRALTFGMQVIKKISRSNLRC